MGKQEKIKEQFDFAWKQYHNAVISFCKYHLNSVPLEIEECCQDVFFSYWDALYRGKEIQNVHAWLLKTAKNKVAAIQRKTNQQPQTVSLEGHEPAVEVDYVEKMIIQLLENKNTVQEIMDSLIREERTLFRKCFQEKQSPAVIAEEMNITVNYLYKKKSDLKHKIIDQVRGKVYQAVHQIGKK